MQNLINVIDRCVIAKTIDLSGEAVMRYHKHQVLVA